MRPRLPTRAPINKDTVRGDTLVHCQLTIKPEKTAILAATRPGAMRLAFLNMLETLTILIGTPDRAGNTRLGGYGLGTMRTEDEAFRLRPSDWIRHGAVFAALATIAIAQPLLQLYGENVAVFAAAGFEGGIILWFAAITVLAPPLAFLAIEIVVTMFFPSQRRRIHNVLVWVLLWLVTLVVLRSVSLGP